MSRICRTHSAFLAMTIAATLSSCNASGLSGTYVGGDDAGAIVLDLVEGEKGKVNGSVAFAQTDYENGRVTIKSKAISGVSDGRRLSLISHAKWWEGSDTTFILQVKGDSLVLQPPGAVQAVALKRSDQQDYVNRLAKLEQSLSANDVGLVPEE